MTEVTGAGAVVIAGVPVVASGVDEAADRLIDLAVKSVPTSVRLVNAFSLASARGDEAYARLLQDPNAVNLADGTPLSWLVKFSGVETARTVRGPSLFTQVLDRGRDREVSHFLLGTTPDELARLELVLRSRYPGINISGSYGPPFGPVDDEFIKIACDRISATDAQLIWIAIGTPKQDFAATKLSEAVGRPCVAVGAAFNFVSGQTREAPEWLQNTGFEWMYRLAREPRRLWRRYLIGNLTFCVIAARHLLRRWTARHESATKN